MTNQNIKFNSRYGIDLGAIQTISISGNKTLSDKVLIVRQNPNTGEYYAEPQDIGIQHGVNDTVLILKDSETNYQKSFVFLNYSEIEEKTIHNITIDFRNKTQGMVSIQGKLLAKEIDMNGTYHNHVFTTGRNMTFQHISQDISMNRHIYDKFVYLYNKGNLKSTSVNTYHEYEGLTNIELSRSYLIPQFSTVGTQNIFLENSKLPYIEIHETSDNVFNINIKCNHLQTNTKQIEWFGNFEIIVSAT
jgi:hypothetical protein